MCVYSSVEEELLWNGKGCWFEFIWMRNTIFTYKTVCFGLNGFKIAKEKPWSPSLTTLLIFQQCSRNTLHIGEPQSNTLSSVVKKRSTQRTLIIVTFPPKISTTCCVVGGVAFLAPCRYIPPSSRWHVALRHWIQWGGWHANMRPLELALKNRRRVRRDIGVLYMGLRRFGVATHSIFPKLW